MDCWATSKWNRHEAGVTIKTFIPTSSEAGVMFWWALQLQSSLQLHSSLTPASSEAGVAIRTSYLKMISIRLPKNVTPAGVKLECLSELSKNTFKWFLLSTNVTPASLQLECLPELSKTLKKWFLLPKNVTPAPLQLHSSYRFSRFSALNVWAQITLFRPMSFPQTQNEILNTLSLHSRSCFTIKISENIKIFFSKKQPETFHISKNEQKTTDRTIFSSTDAGSVFFTAPRFGGNCNSV